MNLRFRHVPWIVAGSVVMGGVGWGLSHAFPTVRLPPIDEDWGKRSTWVILGAGAGIVLATLVSLLRSARDPHGELPASFTNMRGFGSMLIGKREPRSDGSYITTEWFTIALVPVIPICSYRLTHLGGPNYQVHGKVPTIGSDYLKGIARGVAVLAAFAILFGAMDWWIFH